MEGRREGRREESGGGRREEGRREENGGEESGVKGRGQESREGLQWSATSNQPASSQSLITIHRTMSGVLLAAHQESAVD